VVLPGATTLLHYMLVRFRGLVAGLVVRPERMLENIERGHGLHASSRLLTALVENGGLSREDAYVIVQRSAMRAADERRSFRDLLMADPEVAEALSPAQMASSFDDEEALQYAATILARLDTLVPALATADA